MQVPNTASLIFLAYILGFLPWMAFRSAQRVAAARSATSPTPLPSRQAIWTGTLVSLGALMFIAHVTAGTFGYDIFALPALGAREILAGLAALATYFALRAILRAIRPESERRTLAVFIMAPRNTREHALWIATVLAASVAEEAAYRGVGMQILWYSLGSPWLAVAICATAFALAHWMQGWKSGATIFAMALVMHALVAFTGTLVIAMVVHAVYDFVAGHLINRDARRYDQEATA